MTNTNKQLMSAFALSAAALFLGGCKKSGPGPDVPEGAGGGELAADTHVKCFGINSCKGESQCAVNKPELGIDHVCAGENDCQGKGWIKVTKAECDAQGGESLGELS